MTDVYLSLLQPLEVNEPGALKGPAESSERGVGWLLLALSMTHRP